MKKLIAIFSAVLVHGLASAQMSSIEPALRENLTNPNHTNTFYRVRILLSDRINVDSLGQAFDLQKTHFNDRVRITTTLLSEKAAATQPAWISKIEQLEREMHNHLKYIIPYWITNLLVIEAKPALILALVNSTNGIEVMEEDMDQYHVIDPVVESPNSPNAPNGSEIGLRVVKAPALWSRDYTGRGRLGMNSLTALPYNTPASAVAGAATLYPPTTLGLVRAPLPPPAATETTTAPTPLAPWLDCNSALSTPLAWLLTPNGLPQARFALVQVVPRVLFNGRSIQMAI